MKGDENRIQGEESILAIGVSREMVGQGVIPPVERLSESKEYRCTVHHLLRDSQEVIGAC
jgi:hypothetical protein